jgi:hypothetical protein
MIDDDDPRSSIATELREMTARIARLDADVSALTRGLSAKPPSLEAAIGEVIEAHGEAKAFQFVVTTFRRVAKRRPQPHQTIQ